MNPRAHRLAHQLQQEIAMIVQRELKDPGLGFVTITRVELSNDLSHAKVSYGCLGAQDIQERSQEALDRSAGFIQGLIRKRLRLKIIPELVFRYDRSIVESINLSETFSRLHTPPPDEPKPE